MQLLDLYDAELRAELRPAVVRADAALNREDARQRTVEEPRQYQDADQLRPRLRSTVGTSWAALDARQAQLRLFRDVLLMAAVSSTALVAVGVGVVRVWPPDRTQAAPQPTS